MIVMFKKIKEKFWTRAAEIINKKVPTHLEVWPIWLIMIKNTSSYKDSESAKKIFFLKNSMT